MNFILLATLLLSSLVFVENCKSNEKNIRHCFKEKECKEKLKQDCETCAKDCCEKFGVQRVHCYVLMFWC